jgi:hypothetical protein
MGIKGSIGHTKQHYGKVDQVDGRKMFMVDAQRVDLQMKKRYRV